jgi:hypothetical protein
MKFTHRVVLMSATLGLALAAFAGTEQASAAFRCSRYVAGVRREGRRPARHLHQCLLCPQGRRHCPAWGRVRGADLQVGLATGVCPECVRGRPQLLEHVLGGNRKRGGPASGRVPIADQRSSDEVLPAAAGSTLLRCGCIRHDAGKIQASLSAWCASVAGGQRPCAACRTIRPQRADASQAASQSGRIAPVTPSKAPSASSATSSRRGSTGPGRRARPLGMRLKPALA